MAANTKRSDRRLFGREAQIGAVESRSLVASELVVAGGLEAVAEVTAGAAEGEGKSHSRVRKLVMAAKGSGLHIGLLVAESLARPEKEVGDMLDESQLEFQCIHLAFLPFLPSEGGAEDN